MVRQNGWYSASGARSPRPSHPKFCTMKRTYRHWSDIIRPRENSSMTQDQVHLIFWSKKRVQCHVLWCLSHMKVRGLLVLRPVLYFWNPLHIFLQQLTLTSSKLPYFVTSMHLEYACSQVGYDILKSNENFHKRKLKKIEEEVTLQRLVCCLF